MLELQSYSNQRSKKSHNKLRKFSAIYGEPIWQHRTIKEKKNSTLFEKIRSKIYSGINLNAE